MIEQEKISKEINEMRAANKKIIFTNGCFDLLHQGHKDLISLSSSFGDVLVVGLNSDESVRRLKGKDRPIQNVVDRKSALLATGYVDKVYTFENDTPLKLILLVRPDVIVKGGDYDKENVVGSDYADIMLFDFIDGYSTTKILQRTSNR